MVILQDPIDKEQIQQRIEVIIRGHADNCAEIPKLVKDGTFVSTVRTLLESVENETLYDKDYLNRMDYCLYTCESFLSCYDTVEILCDLYLYAFSNLMRERRQFFNSFELSVGNLKSHQAEMWKSYLAYLKTEGKAYFCFTKELFQHILDESHIGSIAPSFSAEIELALLILRTVLYFAADGKRIAKLMFEMVGQIKDNEQTAFYRVCMDEVYNNYRGSCREIAEQYQKAENPFQAELAKQILKQRKAEHEEQILASSIPDLSSSMERFQTYRIAYQECQRRFAKETKKAAVLTQLLHPKTLKYGNRSAFVRMGTDGELYYQVSELASFRYEHELPFLYVASPADWREARATVLSERSKFIAAHHKGLPADTERER